MSSNKLELKIKDKNPELNNLRFFLATSTTLLLIESQQKKYEFNGNKDYISINVETIKQDELFHNDHKVKKENFVKEK